jgi:crotonobetainyl-CoA:carnitine CoA-transferase CaiB-like acyl-CoA transferase
MSSASGKRQRGRTPPLEGIKVLEIAGMYAGPFAGKLLSDFGANVIKVEDARGPDAGRSWYPRKNGLSLGFLRLNGNKAAIAINLRDREGQALVLGLAQKVDVLIEAFRPGRMNRWGLSSARLRALNPRLILLHISGYGQTGPYRHRPGFGTIAEAISGFAFVNGWPDCPPSVAPFGLADQVAGLAGAFAVLVAMAAREKNGLGDDIDLALYEPLMSMLGDSLVRYTATGEIMQRTGGVGQSAAPRGVYETNDGAWIVIAASAQSIVERLFRAMGRSDLITDKRYSTNDGRVEHDAELQGVIRDWVRARDRKTVLATLEKAAVACGPVNDARHVSEDPHFLARNSIVPLRSALIGDVLAPGLIAKMASYSSYQPGNSPDHGQHTSSVLQTVLGMDPDSIASLHRRGVIHAAGV